MPQSTPNGSLNPPHQRPHGLLRSAFIFSALTTFSRVLGYARDAAIFIVFGAGISTDTFLVAFRLPNFLRRLFGEGALSQAFIPVFQQYRREKTAAEAQELIDRTAGSLSLLLFGITVVGVLAAPVLIGVFAPGFIGKDEAFDLSSHMLRITFPYLLFISLVALAGAVLNSYGNFGAPAFSPVLLNMSLIGATLWLAPMMAEPVTALAWGVLFAGVIQLAFQFVWLRRTGVVPRLRIGFDHPGVRRIGKLMTPAILSSAVMQVNLVFDTMIASFLITGSISWLYISDRFVELPLALFGIAISTVMLPNLAAHHAAKDTGDFKRTMHWGVCSSLLLALPCTVGLVLLAGPILAALVQYREFTLHDTMMARLSLAAYATGLPAFMLVKILSSAFYARQNPVTPMRIAVVAMVTNMVLNIALVLAWKALQQPAQHVALALATSIAAWLNCLMLYRALKKDGIFSFQPDTWMLIAKVSAGTLVMGAVLWWVLPPLHDWVAREHWWQRLGPLAAMIVLGASVYLAALALMRVRLRRFLHAERAREDSNP